MGCSQSKIDNEEAVTRCKERKEFMKKAVSARNAFASHHSAYTVALKNTGAALNDYAQGEIHDLQASQSSAPPPPVDPLPPPPPPLPNFPPALLRAASMPEFIIPKPETKPSDTIQEEDDEDMEENDTPIHDLAHHSRHRSAGVGGGSGVGSYRGGGGGGGGARIVEEVAPPPSPPRPKPTNPVPPPPPPEPKESPWDYIFSVDHNMAGSSLSHQDEIRVDNEDFNNKGYHDRFERSDNNDVDDDRRYTGRLKRTEKVDLENDSRYDDRLKRSEKVDFDVNVASASSSTHSVETHIPEKVIEPEVVKPVKKVVMQPVPTETKAGGSVASHVSLLQILNKLDDKFLKAYQSANEVSKILEANRMHYHSNFADNRGNIDHSARLMRVITWNRSIKGLHNPNDVNEEDFDGNDSLASVLDKLLAWEKKLFDEVKAGELMKIEYQRKVASLNKRQKRGTHTEALERAKAAVGHLHTRYVVDIQSMDSTVSEIAHLRDDHLYPKLVSLVEGMARMWDTMNVQHREQMKIVEDLRSLDVSDTPSETSEEHHQRTIQLWGVAKDWHTQFQGLMTCQKDYIIALNSWLRLNLIPIESNLKERVSSPPRVHRPPIQALLHVWHEHLERLPDELARSAISSFAAIMHNIRLHQEDELKLKMRCEETRKDLVRKSRAYDDKYNKYLERTPDGMDAEGTEVVSQKARLGELQIEVELLRQKLKDDEEDYRKHCRQVREKSLASLKSHLPELFRAMSAFSYSASGMYKKLVPLSQSQKQPESVS